MDYTGCIAGNFDVHTVIFTLLLVCPSAQARAIPKATTAMAKTLKP